MQKWWYQASYIIGNQILTLLQSLVSCYVLYNLWYQWNTALHCLHILSRTVLATSVHILICNINSHFGEVGQSLDRWWTARGWRLEKIFLVMRPDKDEYLDWQNLQLMLNKAHFPLLCSINIIQVGGQKVNLTDLLWLTHSTTTSIQFIEIKVPLKITQNYYQPTTFDVS